MSGRRSAGASGPISCGSKSGGPFAFAGLWETWTGPNGEEMDTAAIVTTNANRTLSAIHDRMPVIVPPEAFDLWLDCANVEATTAAALLAPARDDLLEALRSLAGGQSRGERFRGTHRAGFRLWLCRCAVCGERAATKAKPKKPKKPDDQASLL